MHDASVPAIFEAAFEYHNIRIQVDVLERLAHGTWGLREVKSGSGLKDHYLDDIAIQAYVLRGAGVTVSSIALLHVNTDYVRGPNDISWTDYFRRLDVSEAVGMRLTDLTARLPAMWDCLGNALPDAEPGSQCGTPYACEFWDKCTAEKPADWIGYLPRLSQDRARELKTSGIESISFIPPNFPLTSKQTIIRDATVSGVPYVAANLGPLLDTFGPPSCYLDFEAMTPPIPLYEGTRPYQTIPFQWSLHMVDSDGTMGHKEFLADGVSDPRRQFAEALIDGLAGSDDPIIVYSAYEKTRLRELASDFPDLSADLGALTVRLADLLPVVRTALYLPEFQYSNSIKSVAPALCPGFTYDDLKVIADGGAASATFLQIVSGLVECSEQVHQLRHALLAYCERDTLALLEVHRALLRLALSAKSGARS
ncbi:DUF2779 domain-containing protein [Bradyrhizobium sp. AUGA SZCCT0177]|nr:DUF2779 domain-containing protein [Bradyrhizobium sp. AUGA SZCCT0177]